MNWGTAQTLSSLKEMFLSVGKASVDPAASCTFPLVMELGRESGRLPGFVQESVAFSTTMANLLSFLCCRHDSGFWIIRIFWKSRTRGHLSAWDLNFNSEPDCQSQIKRAQAWRYGTLNNRENGHGERLPSDVWLKQPPRPSSSRSGAEVPDRTSWRWRWRWWWTPGDSTRIVKYTQLCVCCCCCYKLRTKILIHPAKWGHYKVLWLRG